MSEVYVTLCFESIVFVFCDCAEEHSTTLPIVFTQMTGTFIYYVSQVSGFSLRTERTKPSC